MTSLQKFEWVALGYDEGTLKHRLFLLDILKKHLPFETLLDVGCAHGPDLALINMEMPEVKCSGFDITEGDIADGKKRLPECNLWVGDVREELYKVPDKSYDVVLTNGVMMYNDLKYINELVRIAKKVVIMSERDPDQKMWLYISDELKKLSIANKITEEVRDSWKQDGYVYEIII